MRLCVSTLLVLLCVGCEPNPGPDPAVVQQGGCFGPLAAAAGRLYWVDGCRARLLSMPAEGGTADLRADGARFEVALIPGPIVRDDASLYWVSNRRLDGLYQIERISMASGQIEEVYSGMEKIWNLAVAGGYAYWTEWIDDGATYRLLRVPLDRRSGLEVVGSGPEEMRGPWAAEDGVFVAVLRPASSGGVETTFRRYLFSGGPPVEVWTEPGVPIPVTSYAGSLYWIFHGQDPRKPVLRTMGPGAQEPATVEIGKHAIGLDVDASGVLVHTIEPRGNPWQSMVPWSLGYPDSPQYIEHFTHDLSRRAVLAGWMSDQPANGTVGDGSRVFWASSDSHGNTIESLRLYSAPLP